MEQRFARATSNFTETLTKDVDLNASSTVIVQLIMRVLALGVSILVSVHAAKMQFVKL